ncbi:gamma-glutamyltranspeptidase [Candidatus Magnetomorum sp. HK-1]|nr:gamma-glutamyltranspeptidase [Candidatus Magnetomorum sp. HK-1]
MKISTIEDKFEETPDGKCTKSQNGMVATAFPDATQAGVEILSNGGNAIDAACAAAFALGVCEPQASGLGGQSLAILHQLDKTVAIDGSSCVPSLAHLSRFEKNQRSFGYKATTVPSTVAVLGYLHFRYGRIKWRDVLQPAIRIAQEGYRITQLQHDLQKRELDNFLKIKSKSGAKYFLKDKKPYALGDLFIQNDLANVLSEIAENGPRSFYQGLISQRINEDMEKHDGFIRNDDLARIPWPVERKPICRKYRNVRICSIPPPAAGNTLLLVLMMLNYIPPKYIRNNSPESYHFIAETFRKAFMYRKQRSYDPNTYFQIPDKKMISHEFAKEQAWSIRDRIDPDLPILDPPQEDTDTTHLSVIDNQGNAIGITQSIELAYGAKVAADGLGFLYNNYMREFEVKDPSHPHYLRPGASPWTSVAPAIVFYKNKPWMVTGSPGGERIYSTVAQFLIQMFDKKVSMGDAIKAQRMHCSVGGTIYIEENRFDSNITDYLKEMGYKIVEKPPFYYGAIHSVMKCVSKKEFHGVAEVRRDGTAGGI